VEKSAVSKGRLELHLAVADDGIRGGFGTRTTGGCDCDYRQSGPSLLLLSKEKGRRLGFAGETGSRLGSVYRTSAAQTCNEIGAAGVNQRANRINGRDVRLTIDPVVQRYVYTGLVKERPNAVERAGPAHSRAARDQNALPAERLTRFRQLGNTARTENDSGRDLERACSLFHRGITVADAF
jgi:hypothetical protein